MPRVITAMIFAVVLRAELASACATCFAASGAGALWAYYFSTILLSSMPILMIGLIVLFALISKRRSMATRAPGKRHSGPELGNPPY